jgi:hypothetical protein
MAGIVELETLLMSLAPDLSDTEYVFCSLPERADFQQLKPLATFAEEEGVSLVIARDAAERADIAFEGTFRLITLKVHSSLEAVGLTAAVAGKLADQGISANVIAAYYHDHILVPADRALEAVEALIELGTQPRSHLR